MIINWTGCPFIWFGRLAQIQVVLCSAVKKPSGNKTKAAPKATEKKGQTSAEAIRDRLRGADGGAACPGGECTCCGA